MLKARWTLWIAASMALSLQACCLQLVSGSSLDSGVKNADAGVDGG